ncbi:MAG: IS1380 family transposase [Alphaproteobacteria bacterium]|nr:MAG: IS1380 family transposase [Alphaproteobacteria bacterium]
MAQEVEHPGLLGQAHGRDEAAGLGSSFVFDEPNLIAGMLAGADSIDDMDVLRHGGTKKIFTELRAPSTLGTFLRIFTHGHVRQLDAVNSRMLLNLQTATVRAGQALLPEADELVYVDIDDTIRQTYGYAKQGAGYGYSKVKGLNAMILTATTPTSASVILGARLRKGSTASARGASKLLADGLATLKRTTASSTASSTGASSVADADNAAGLVIVRADSAYYNHDVVATVRRAQARFSITTRSNPALRRAISAIPDDSWTAIKYTDAVWDEEDKRWVSDAEVAETQYTAFTGRRKAEHVTARLIVRRVKRLNPTAGAGAGNVQGELFDTYRYHAVFTDSPMSMLIAEKAHRAHAIVESTIAELKDNALAHLPSGKFQANAAWLMLAVIAHNLTRTLAALAGAGHRRERMATIRRKLISLPARIASSGRKLRLHAPHGWRWQAGFDNVLAAIKAVARPVAHPRLRT